MERVEMVELTEEEEEEDMEARQTELAALVELMVVPARWLEVITQSMEKYLRVHL